MGSGKISSSPRAIPASSPFAVSAGHVWDHARWETLCVRHLQLAREVGALSELPLALSQRIYVHLFAGELGVAAQLTEEVRAATEATGSTLACPASGEDAPRGPICGAAARRSRTRCARARISSTEKGFVM